MTSRFISPIFRSVAKKVLKYTAGFTLKDLIHDDRTFDAILRNLEIIGEAVKHVSDETKARYPQIKWRKIGDFRNIVATDKIFPLGEKVKSLTQPFPRRSMAFSGAGPAIGKGVGVGVDVGVGVIVGVVVSVGVFVEVGEGVSVGALVPCKVGC
jgi:hypothetical protein